MLWSPQSEALDALSVVYREEEEESQGKQPQIIQIPTGCGKSTVIALLPRYLVPQRHCTVLVIVPNLVLVEQTISAIQAAYERHPRDSQSQIQEDIGCKSIASLEELEECIDAISAEGNTPVDERQVKYRFLVCNVHKLHQRNGVGGSSEMPLWQKIEEWIDSVAVDEAHHMVAFMWKNFLLHPNALGGRMKRLVLVTATPFRTDEVPLRGEMCYRYAYRRGIEAGLIKHPIIHLFKPSNRLEERDLRDVRLLQRTERLLSGEPRTGQAIGYAQDIVDAERILNLARLHTTLRVEVWHSNMSEEAQREIRSRFEQPSSFDPTQRIDMVIQVKMCVEGYDHPPVSVVTFFRVVRSPLFFIQAVGRAARRTQEDRQLGRALVSYVVTDNIYCSSSLWEYFKAHSDDGQVVEFSTDDFGEDTNLPSSSSSSFSSSSTSHSGLVQGQNGDDRTSSSSSPISNSVPSPGLDLGNQEGAVADRNAYSTAQWWIDLFDPALRPLVVPVSMESDDDDDDGDDDDGGGEEQQSREAFNSLYNGSTNFSDNRPNSGREPTMTQSSEDPTFNVRRSCLNKIFRDLQRVPCFQGPFVLSKYGFKVVVPPPSSSEKVKEPKKRKVDGPSMVDLTEKDVGLASLPPPFQHIFTAFACHDCPRGQVRELSLSALRCVFIDHRRKQIERILACNNRVDGKPLISDRLFAHYHEQQQQHKKRYRPAGDGVEETKRQCTHMTDISETLKQLEEKERVILQARQAVQQLQLAQQQAASFFALW